MINGYSMIHLHCLQIFGPILPIVTVDDLDGAIDYINSKLVYTMYIYFCSVLVVLTYREKPLVIYAFTTDKQVQKTLSTRTSSGTFTVNDVMTQFLGM